METQRIGILVVDDEVNIAELVGMALRHEGFEVQVAFTGQEALQKVESFRPALVILDVMLPDIDGHQVLQRMANSGHVVPTIFLTARDATEDKVRGLTIGAEDYVTKPFSLEELIARVRVVLRRGAAAAAQILRVADLEMDDEAHEVTRKGVPIEMTPTEYRLLRYLMANAGRVLSRAQILDHVWNYDFGGEAGVLDTYISYLRRKIDHLQAPLLHTVRGVGFVIRPPKAR